MSKHRRFYRPRVEPLERRDLLTHFSPVDLGDGLGPKFIGDGFTTVTEDFSDNPNHEDWSTVPGGFDSLQAGFDRLFTHSANPVQIVPASQLDIPRTLGPSHVLALGTSDVAEIHFRGIHPDYEVAAISVDTVSDGFGDVRTTVIGSGGSLVFDQAGHHVATRGSLLPGSQTELGSIQSIRFFNMSFVAAVDNVTLLLAPRETNDAPTAFNDRATTPPQTPLVIDVLNNDFDPDADPLTISIPTAVTLRGGQVEVFGQGILYTPPTSFPLPSDQTPESRTDRFDYAIRDEDGNSATASVEVLVNTPPFQMDTVVVRPRGAASASGIFSSGFDAEGDPLTLEIVAGPERGQLVLDLPSGSFEYRPDDPGDLAEDSFTYRVRDSVGAASNVATARLRVANRAPVASGFSSFREHGTLGPLEGMLGSDPDGDALSIEFLPLDHDNDPLTPEVTGPQHGRLELLSDGRFRYDQLAPDYIHWASGRLVTNDLRFRGPERFRYRLRDHDFASQPAVMEVNVPNLRPESDFLESAGAVVTVDRFRVPPEPISFAEPGVLWNDIDHDGDPLSAILVDGPEHGTLVLRPDGSFTYVPDAGYAGLDGFRYRASDGFSISDLTQVELLVEPGAPLATSDFYSQFAAEYALALPPQFSSFSETILSNDLLGANILRAKRIISGIGLSSDGDGSWLDSLVSMDGAIGNVDPELIAGQLTFEELFLGTRYFAYLLEGRDGYLSNTALVTLHSDDADTDGDGVLDSEEGILDMRLAFSNPRFARVANAIDGRPIEISASLFGEIPGGGSGVLAEVDAVAAPDVPPPAGVEFPVGLVEFTIRELAAGEATNVTITLPPGVETNSYWKFGRQPADDPATAGLDERTTPHWYEFLFDGVTGAEFLPLEDGRTRVTLHLVDGQRGDDDLVANGVIVDPGAPAFAPPPRVQSVVIGDGAAQRSMIRSLTITFDGLIEIDRGAFAVQRLGWRPWNMPLKVAVHEAAGNTVATLTFRGRATIGGSLADGHYRLIVRSGKIRDAFGRLLDGDADGTAGGHYVDEFFRRYGDTDGDGDVDFADRLVFDTTFGTRRRDAEFLWYLDFNSNGKVGREDRALFRLAQRLSRWR